MGGARCLLAAAVGCSRHAAAGQLRHWPGYSWTWIRDDPAKAEICRAIDFPPTNHSWRTPYGVSEPTLRRQFLTKAVSATAVSLIASPSAPVPWRSAAAAEPASAPRDMQMKLSFMTFVCPTWTMDKIVKFAKEAGYEGVEIRVDAGHQHGLSSKSSDEARRQTRKLFADEGVEIAAVATSVNFANPRPDVHKAQLEAAKVHLDLAADLGAPVVRIFAGGGIPKLTSEAARQVAAAFDEVGEYAQGSGSCPILECGHDIIRRRRRPGKSSARCRHATSAPCGTRRPWTTRASPP